MTISSELTALQQDITNARTAITTKGGTVTTSGGSSQLATDISTIPTGVTPTGTISITQNGSHDVTNYATANVNVPNKKWGVSTDNYFRLSAKETPDLEDFVYNNINLPSGFTYALRYAGLKSISLTGNNLVTNTNYSYAYAFAENNYLEDVVIDFDERTLGFSSYIFYYMFNNCGATINVSPYTNPYTNFTMYCKNINGSYVLNCAFSYATGFKYFSFPNLEKIGTTGNNVFKDAFDNCYQCYRPNAGINMFRFPVLNQIGGNGTSFYANFSYAFWCSASPSNHYCELIFPELEVINCRASSASNGQFNQCNALNKVYLPKFKKDNLATTGTTYSRYLFNSCNNISELHFGIENQSDVEALSGYSYKFGATNATIYFDMPNHLTVSSTVYDRSGAEYDYDNSYYSWKNGNNVIYTTNAINPAVGDTVYTKSGDTYTEIGTIEAIS